MSRKLILFQNICSGLKNKGGFLLVFVCMYSNVAVFYRYVVWAHSSGGLGSQSQTTFYEVLNTLFILCVNSGRCCVL